MHLLAQLAFNDPGAVGPGGQPWAFWALLALGAAGLVAVLFRADDGREERRMKAIEAAGDLKAIGLDQSAYICSAYAVGDYSGMAKAAKQLVEEARGRGGADGIARDIVLKSLPGLLNHPEHGPAVRAAIAAASSKGVVEANPQPTLQRTALGGAAQTFVR